MTPVHLLTCALIPLCTPAVEAAPADLTGTWAAFEGGAPALVLSLHGRAGGGVLGHVPGDPGARVLGGLVTGSVVRLDLAGEDGGGSWTSTFNGFLAGSTLTGALDDGVGLTPLTLHRIPPRYAEETWALIDGDSQEIVRVGALRSTTGAFVLGGFANAWGCSFLACGGRVTAWNATPTTHDIQVSGSGACSGPTTLTGSFDSGLNILAGTWSETGCPGTPATGSFMGLTPGGTTATHVLALLRSLAGFADAFESESEDALDVFHSAFLHDGKTRADWRREFRAWWADFDAIEVDLSIDEVLTVAGSDAQPIYLDGPRLRWRLSARGTLAATGAELVFWEHATEVPFGTQLHYLATQQGRWVFVGNGEAAPFEMGLPLHLADSTNTTNGLWPFGVHGGGHPEGHPGIDLEYLPGSKVIAGTDGPVVMLFKNEGHPPVTLYDVFQKPRKGVLVQYGTIMNPVVALGAMLARGDVVGDPFDHSLTPSSNSAHSIHLGLGLMLDTTPPTERLDAAARLDLGAIWSQAFYAEELTEPRLVNALVVGFPLRAEWRRTTAGTGSSAERIVFENTSALDNTYRYELRDAAGGALLEAGDAAYHHAYPSGRIYFTPDAVHASAPFEGRCDVVGETLLLDFGASMPPDLAGASVYVLEGP